MTIDVLKRLALDAEKDGRLADALNLYRLALVDAEATGRRPVIPPLQVRVGLALMKLGQSSGAVPLLECAGHAYARYGRGPEVVEIGYHVVRATRDSVHVFLGWARTLVEHGHAATATAVLEVFVRRSPAAHAAALRDAAPGLDGQLLQVVEGVVEQAGRMERASVEISAPRVAVAAGSSSTESSLAPAAGSVGEPPAPDFVPPARIERYRSSPGSRPLRLRPRPGTPGWRDAATSAVVPDADPDPLGDPEPFIRSSPSPAHNEDALLSEPFFRRTPRSRWRPLVEIAFWLTAAAATVMLLFRVDLI